MTINYKGKNQDEWVNFKTSESYPIFKNEYESAIDIVIQFYSQHEKDSNLVSLVRSNLQELKIKIFNDEATYATQYPYFRAKEDMDAIVVTLEKPIDREFSQIEINKRVDAISRLAKNCLVCSVGTRDNIADALRNIEADNIAKIANSKAELLMENAILAYIREHKEEINKWQPESRWKMMVNDVGMEIHAIRIFKNTFSQEFNIAIQDDYFIENMPIPEEAKAGIGAILRKKIGINNITAILADNYLTDIRSILPPGSNIDYNMAIDAFNGLRSVYGEHITVYDVFIINEDDNSFTDIKTDPMGIKIGIAKGIIELQGENIGAGGIQWSIENFVEQEKPELWHCGDLFWHQDAEGTKTLPSVSLIGEEHINQISPEQLIQIIHAAPRNGLTAQILQTVRPERLLDIANAEDVIQFFAKLNVNDSMQPDQAVLYAEKHTETFRKFIDQVGINPFVDRYIANLSGKELQQLSLESDIRLYSLKNEQFNALLLKLQQNGIDIKAYATQQQLDSDQSVMLFAHLLEFDADVSATLNWLGENEPLSWFKNLTDRLGINPLLTAINQLSDKNEPDPYQWRLPVTLKEQVAHHLDKVFYFPPDILFENKQHFIQQTVEFLYSLDPEAGEMKQALLFIHANLEWFKNLVNLCEINPLLNVTGETLSPFKLNKLTPQDLNIVFYPPSNNSNGYFTRQISLYFDKLLNGWEENNWTLEQLITFASTHRELFEHIIENSGINPLLNLASNTLSTEQLQLLNPDSDIIFYAPSTQVLQAQLREKTLFFIHQIEWFLTKLIAENRDFSQATKFVRSHGEWFQKIINNSGKNPLLEIAMELLPSEQLKEMLSDFDILFSAPLDENKNDFTLQVVNFLNKFVKNDHNFSQLLEFLNNNDVWYCNLIKKLSCNPLLTVALKRLSPDELKALAPDFATLFRSELFGKFPEYKSQVVSFWRKILGDNSDCGQAIAFAKANFSWFEQLNKIIGFNPLILEICYKHSQFSLEAVDLDILFSSSTTKSQVEVFFSLLYKREYGDKYFQFGNKILFSPLYKTFVDKYNDNVLAKGVLKVINATGLLSIKPDHILFYRLSDEAWDLFSSRIQKEKGSIMSYFFTYKTWFENHPGSEMAGRIFNNLSPEDREIYAEAIVILQRLLPATTTDEGEPSVKRAKYSPTLSEIAPFDDKPVSTWNKPAVQQDTESETSRFEYQLIIQLEDDDVVRDAAVHLVAKHRKNSLLKQLDTYGNVRDFYLNDQGGWVEGIPDSFNVEKLLRVQLVGHGRGGVDGLNHLTLGGRTAEALAEQLGHIKIGNGTKISPEHISLVGCSLVGNEAEKGFIHQFAPLLTLQDIHPSSIGAYATEIVVNKQGQKRLTETSEKVILTQHEGQWITTRIPGKVKLPGAEYRLLASLDRIQDFEQGMGQLYRDNQLSTAEWLPMLHTLKEDASQPRHFSLEFVHKDSAKASPKIRTVRIDDPRIADFIQEYDSQLASAKDHFYFADGQLVPRSEGGDPEAEGIHGLNTAFILQAWLNERARNATAEDHLPANLGTALRVHGYANLTQLGWGALDDTVKFIQLVKEISGEGAAVGGMFRTFSQISSAVGTTINALFVGLDSYELAHAQNEAQRAVFGTQLAFDLANLTTSVVSLTAAAVGAETLAAFAGPLAVPLVGLGIGITALVQATQVHIEETKAVGRYFADLDAGYQEGGYRQVEVTGADGTAHSIWINSPGITISTLNFRKQQLTFAGTYIYKTHIYPGTLGTGYTNMITLAKPDSEKNRSKLARDKKTINIREGINHKNATVHFTPAQNIPLILPSTPQYYIDYSYNFFPGVTSRSDRGFEVLRRLEKNYQSRSNNFSFDFYNCPTEYAINKLSFEFEATPVQVILDDASRMIIMPSLAQEAKGKMAYTLEGGNGTYHISLQEGAALRLTKGSQKTEWVLDARSLPNVDKPHFNQHGKLQIGSLQVTLSDMQGTLNLVSNKGRFTVDLQKKQMTEIDTDAHGFKNWQSLHDHLKQVSHADFHNQPFIAVENYLTSEGKQVGRAFYETARDRFIYTNQPRAVTFLNSAQLAKVEGNKAWFYCDATVWQVDIVTGEVLLEYVPLDFGHATSPRHSQVVTDDAGHLYFIVEYLKNEKTVRYTWQLTGQAMKLIAIAGEELPTLNETYWPSLVPQFTSTTLVSGTFGEEIHQVSRQDGRRVHSWFKPQAGKKEYAPFLCLNLADAPADIQSVPITAEDNTSYYFYSRQQKELYFQPDDGLSGQVAHEVKENIHTLFAVQGQLIAQSEEGALWLADYQGSLRLAGVTADWLQVRRQDVMKPLRELISTVATLPVLRLQGLTNSQGKMVMAWYDIAADKVIVSGSGIQSLNSLNYLGLSPDGKQAWIFDGKRQRLYCQPVGQDNALTFNEQGHLSPVVPPAVRWSARKYRNAVSHGATLRLTTLDGAVLSLPKAASMQDKPQLIAWHTEEDTPFYGTCLSGKKICQTEMVENKLQKIIRKEQALQELIESNQELLQLIQMEQAEVMTITPEQLRPPEHERAVEHQLQQALQLMIERKQEIIQQLANVIESLGDQVTLAPAIRLLSNQKETPPIWYLTEQKTLLRTNLDREHNLRYLGQAAGESGSYIHDQTTGDLWLVTGSHSDAQGRYPFILQSKEVLLLQTAQSDQARFRILPQLRGVERLAMTGQTDNTHYVLDTAVLSHYRSIVINEQGEQSVIQLPQISEAGFLVQREGQDICLLDPHSNHLLRITNVEQAGQRGMNFVVADAPPLPVKQLLEKLARLHEVNPTANWFKLIVKEDRYQLQGADPGQMMIQHREIISTGNNDTYRYVKGSGQTVIEDRGGLDILSFDDISYARLLFSRKEHDLVIKVADSEDSVTIKGAFSTPGNPVIEIIRSADNGNLQVSELITAMKEVMPSETVISLPGSDYLTVKDGDGRVSQLKLNDLTWAGIEPSGSESSYPEYVKQPFLNNEILFLKLLDARQSEALVMIDRRPPVKDPAIMSKAIVGSGTEKNVISVTHGNVNMFGGSKADELSVLKSGNNTLFGYEGEDVLQVTGGHNTLYGGQDSDTYRIGGKISHALISDSEGDNDMLSLEYDGIDMTKIRLTRENDDLLITVAERPDQQASLITIKNQFDKAKSMSIEVLKIIGTEKRWEYSLSMLTEAMHGLDQPDKSAYTLSDVAGRAQLQKSDWLPGLACYPRCQLAG